MTTKNYPELTPVQYKIKRQLTSTLDRAHENGLKLFVGGSSIFLMPSDLDFSASGDDDINALDDADYHVSSKIVSDGGAGT